LKKTDQIKIKKMAKSKVRGGAKAHRKKVEARNQKIDGQRNAMQKLFEESMRKQIEELKKRDAEAKSGDTENIL
jgi:translation initiation factor 2B subunit (eIF-2B alpha/beta/delta family)